MCKPHQYNHLHHHWMQPALNVWHSSATAPFSYCGIVPPRPDRNLQLPVMVDMLNKLRIPLGCTNRVDIGILTNFLSSNITLFAMLSEVSKLKRLNIKLKMRYLRPRGITSLLTRNHNRKLLLSRVLDYGFHYYI